MDESMDDDSGISNGSDEREEREDSPIPEGQYEVEEIVDYIRDNKGELYLIKWKGWDEAYNTWEPPSSFSNCLEAMTAFYLKRKAEIDQIMEESEYVTAENGRKRRKGPPLRMVLPPDPRSALIRANEFYKATRFPTEDEVLLFEKLWKKDLRAKLNKEKRLNSKDVVSRWARIQFEKALQLHLRDVTCEKDEGIRKQFYIQQLDELREIALEQLKDWETHLNEISEGKPLIKVENKVDWEGPPKDFTYVNDYCPSDGITIPDDPIMGCSCFSDGKTCYEQKKSCCAAHSEADFAYTLYKKVNVPVGTPIYECNKKCDCGPDCSNRVVQDGRENLSSLRLSIFRTSNGRGWGVKTLKSIKKGAFVSLYLGEIITSEEAERRGKTYDQNGCTYLFDLDINEMETNPYTVDAAKYGNITHFINHSCDPNLAVYSVFVNCLDVNLPKLALFAKKDISRGEELSFDYEVTVTTTEKGADGEESGKLKLPCLCRSSNCRQFLF